MPPNKQEVVDLIRKAFRDVKLGNGVGLWEGQAWDGPCPFDADVRRQERERDEKLDWQLIPAESLNDCYSSLCFLDAEGMRFHLPAFLIAELEGKVNMDWMFHLTHLDDYAKGKLVLLSKEQKQAVVEFLRFVRDSGGYESDRPAIDWVLSHYWCGDDEKQKS